MPTFRAEHLLRDKRLQWLQEQGITVAYTKLTQPDLLHALRTTLLETATDAALAEIHAEMLKELAELLEVAVALAAGIGVSEADLLAKMHEKRAEFGSFAGGVLGQSVTMPAGHPSIPYYREHPEKYPEINADGYDG